MPIPLITRRLVALLGLLLAGLGLLADSAARIELAQAVDASRCAAGDATAGRGAPIPAVNG